MDLLEHIHAAKPEVVHRKGETCYRWCGTLAVIVRDGHEVCQFVTNGMWKRTEVEQSIRRYIELGS